MAGEDADQAAADLHMLLIEVLKQLNQAEAEEPQGEGLEPGEIALRIRKGPVPTASVEECHRACGTLVENRMAEVVEAGQYAWDRGRTLGRRYVLTSAGKTYLLQQLERTGRIG
jgi:hypothetical protein